jgi:hypothetical protein
VHGDDAGVVGQHDRDGAAHGVPGQAGPAFGLDDGERVELARVAHEQRPLEQPGDLEEQIRAHLVRLVDDRPRPHLGIRLGDGGPLGRGRQDHGAVAQVRDRRAQLDVGPGYPVAADIGGGAQPPDQEVLPLVGQAGDEVVDLLVGLAEDHDPLPRVGELV